MLRIMILGSSSSQVPAILTAKKMGYYVISVDRNKDSVGFAFSDEGLNIGTDDFDGIKKYIEEKPIDGIMTLASDRAVNTIAKIGEHFKLNTISVDAAKNATNKVNMRRILSEHNISAPHFYVASNFSDFIKNIDNFNQDIIIKASDNSGKRGIIKLSKNASIEEKEKAFNNAYENSISKEVLVEELIYGKEFSVESITFNGETSIITVTNKYNTGPPSYVEIGHSQPGDLSYKQFLDLELLVKKTIKALGINNTGSHAEVMINDKGIFLIEIGPRLGGDNISTSLVMLSSGVDMVKASIQMCLGETPDFERKFNRGSSIQYILPENGIFMGYELIDDITKTEGYYEHSFTKSSGYEMIKLSNSNDRIGYVIFSGVNAHDAEEKALAALKSIKLIIDKK